LDRLGLNGSFGANKYEPQYCLSLQKFMKK
jgi:hypothetical protein